MGLKLAESISEFGFYRWTLAAPRAGKPFARE